MQAQAELRQVFVLLLACIALCASPSTQAQWLFWPMTNDFFVESALSPMPFGGDDIVAADFDGDGRIDLALAHGRGISVFRGRPRGDFEPGTSIAGPMRHIGKVLVADFNLNSHPDLIALDYGGWTNQRIGAIWKIPGLGNGEFGPPSRVISNILRPLEGVVADFNNDGRPDLAFTQFHPLVLSVYLANDAGYEEAVGSPFPLGPSDFGRIFSADLNGDGNIDLITPRMIFFGDGQGGFTPALAFPGLPTQTVLGVADLNGDGRADLILGTDSGAVEIFYSENGGTFSLALSLRSEENHEVTRVEVADFDADGRLDILVFHGSLLRFWRGQADGSFVDQPAESRWINGVPSGAVAIADLNGDLRPDLVFASTSLLFGHGLGPAAAFLNIIPRGAPAEFSEFTVFPSPALEEAGAMTVTVRRSGGLDSAVSLRALTFPAPLFPSTNFIPVDLKLTFAPGVVEHSFEIELIDDEQVSKNNNFLVEFELIEGRGIPPWPALVTIIEDDPIQLWLPGDLTVVEEDMILSVPVKRSGSINSKVVYRANYVVEYHTASGNPSYPRIEGVLEFGPGVTERVLDVPIHANSAVDGGSWISVRFQEADLTANSRSSFGIHVLDDECAALIQKVALGRHALDAVALAPLPQGGWLGLSRSSELYRLTPDGAFDAAFGIRRVGLWTQYGRMHPLRDGSVLISGYAANEPLRVQVQRFTASGEFDPGFHYVPPGPPGWIDTAIELSSGELLIRSYRAIHRCRADGTILATLWSHPESPSPEIQIDGFDRIYSPAGPGLGRFDLNFSRDASYNPVPNVQLFRAFHVMQDGAVYAIVSAPGPSLLHISPDGTKVTTLASGGELIAGDLGLAAGINPLPDGRILLMGWQSWDRYFLAVREQNGAIIQATPQPPFTHWSYGRFLAMDANGAWRSEHSGLTRLLLPSAEPQVGFSDLEVIAFASDPRVPLQRTGPTGSPAAVRCLVTPVDGSGPAREYTVEFQPKAGAAQLRLPSIEVSNATGLREFDIVLTSAEGANLAGSRTARLVVIDGPHPDPGKLRVARLGGPANILLLALPAPDIGRESYRVLTSHDLLNWSEDWGNYSYSTRRPLDGLPAAFYIRASEAATFFRIERY